MTFIQPSNLTMFAQESKEWFGLFNILSYSYLLPTRAKELQKDVVLFLFPLDLCTCNWTRLIWLFDLSKACHDGRKVFIILVHTISDVLRDWTRISCRYINNMFFVFRTPSVCATVVISCTGFYFRTLLFLAKLPLD